MSSILEPIIMLAAMGAGLYFVMHRCDVFGICGAGAPTAAAATPPVDPAAAAAEAAAAVAAAAAAAQGAVDPVTGLTQAQLNAQAEHLKDRGQAGNEAQRKDIEARQSKTSDADAQNIKVNVCASQRCKKNPSDFICVQSGCHNSVIKDLTKNVQKTSAPSKTSCKAGQILVCKNPTAAGTITCSCSKPNNFTGMTRTTYQLAYNTTAAMGRISYN